MATIRSSTAWQQWLRFFPQPLGGGGYDFFLNELTVKHHYDSTTIRYRRPVSYRSRTR